MAENDAAAAEGGAGEGEAAQGAKPGKGKLKLFAILGAVVALLAVAGYFYLDHARKKKEEEDNTVEARLKKQLQYKKENAPPIFIPLDEFIVNLPGRGGEHYLQVKMVLRASDPTTEAKIKNFMPIIRDKIIIVLSSRTMQELATVEGKSSMTKEIALVINSIIEPQLTAIYVLQQQPSTADLQNLERIGAVPKETSAGEKLSQTAIEAASQFWKVTEMDLPVQAVLFNSFVMQ